MRHNRRIVKWCLTSSFIQSARTKNGLNGVFVYDAEFVRPNTDKAAVLLVQGMNDLVLKASIRDIHSACLRNLEIPWSGKRGQRVQRGETIKDCGG